MKAQRQDAARTRGSLLRAASEVFAERGYRDTTIAEISERARTNIAAVNYHFGDKATLYREAWRYAFRQSIETHPPDGGSSESAPVEERLKAQVLALLSRITDPANREFMIVHNELANPTGLLEEVMHEEVLPISERMEGLVREVLGPDAPKMKVRFCAIATIGQCVMATLINRLERLERQARHDSWRIGDIEAYAGHVAAFSLAGMRATGRAIEEGRATRTPPRKKPGLRRTTAARRKVLTLPAGERSLK